MHRISWRTFSFHKFSGINIYARALKYGKLVIGKFLSCSRAFSMSDIEFQLGKAIKMKENRENG